MLFDLLHTDTAESSPPASLMLKISICLDSATHGKAVLPAHLSSCNLQISRLMKGQGKRNACEGNAINALWLRRMLGYHLCVWFWLLCVYLTPLSVQCSERFSQEIFLIPVSLIM